MFLDEIGELSGEIQAQLLRFLDDGEYSKVGEATIRHADIRVVAATNRDLETMCADGTFRKDLFYRLFGTIIRTVPLRERKADIVPLVWHFLSLFGSAKNITYGITGDACSRLLEEDWPGNVRQLKQVLYKICQISDTRNISLVDVQRVLGCGDTNRHRSYREAKQQILLDFDRDYLLKTLYLAQGSLKKALQLSGMHKKNFYEKIKQLGMSVKDYSRPSDGLIRCAPEPSDDWLTESCRPDVQVEWLPAPGGVWTTRSRCRLQRRWQGPGMPDALRYRPVFSPTAFTCFVRGRRAVTGAFLPPFSLQAPETTQSGLPALSPTV